MKASFEISLQKLLSPRSIKDKPYIALAQNKGDGSRSIAIVNPHGVTYIDDDGGCTYSAYDYFEDSYEIVELPNELSITFRN